MPTQHVEPASDDHLQQIADSLFKARKVIVVTGAGISTNSGIPDFRSENGLYSLIQAQFDAAARLARPGESSDSDKDEASFEEPPAKRRRLSPELPESLDLPDLPLPEPRPEEPEETKDVIECSADTGEAKDVIECNADTIVVSGRQEEASVKSEDEQTAIDRQLFDAPHSTQHITTSPLSSPPPEDFILTPCGIRSSTRDSITCARIRNTPIALSSSPLSSPPPGLFASYMPSSPSDASPSTTSPSEVSASDEDDSQSSNPISSSQISKTSLPNMKGKDLFDASIWSDPLRTSVFYTFATTLRQKVRDVEPTPSHRFISHLRDRGKLVRCYTQNIDQIEEKVGLSTCLNAGPGSRGRFSRRSTANMAQLSKMVEEVSGNGSSDKTSSSHSDTCEEVPGSSTDGNENKQEQTEDQAKNAEQEKQDPPPIKRELSRTGVECVFLHGSLEQLRCFLCGRVCSWDDGDRQTETLSGQQPECPHCAGATAAREERGKRALGVGKLRPDIVLYGEEHPNAHLISPIVTHDLALQPDMLLILGTSLRVHGLKVMVREFAKAVHTKGGKVVFVNFTKPPESSWGDIIDYWIQWDCDAWVDNLQGRVPKLWQALEPPKPKKKRESGGGSDNDTKRPPAANPVAQRDTKATGAYWTTKILGELHRITGTEPPQRRASISAAPAQAPASDLTISVSPLAQKLTGGRAKRPRKSAPGALERPKKPSSTLNPNHGRSRRSMATAISTPVPKPEELPTATPSSPINSIIDSVKSKHRVRRPKMIDGVEVVRPKIGKRGSSSNSSTKQSSPAPAPLDLTLPPFSPQPDMSPPSPYGRPEPLEPKSPPQGPPVLLPISANRRSARNAYRRNAFPIQDPLLFYMDHKMVVRHNKAESNAADALAELRHGR